MDFGKVIHESVEKSNSFYNKRIYIYGLQTFWSHYAYIPLYMHKALPTLGN